MISFILSQLPEKRNGREADLRHAAKHCDRSFTSHTHVNTCLLSSSKIGVGHNDVILASLISVKLGSCRLLSTKIHIWGGRGSFFKRSCTGKGARCTTVTHKPESSASTIALLVERGRRSEFAYTQSRVATRHVAKRGFLQGRRLCTFLLLFCS